MLWNSLMSVTDPEICPRRPDDPFRVHYWIYFKFKFKLKLWVSNLFGISLSARRIFWDQALHFIYKSLIFYNTIYSIIYRCPEHAEDSLKIRYHNAKAVLRKNLVGIGYEIYVTHLDDLIYGEFVELIGVH